MLEPECFTLFGLELRSWTKTSSKKLQNPLGLLKGGWATLKSGYACLSANPIKLHLMCKQTLPEACEVTRADQMALLGGVVAVNP